jgi:dTDP-4-dehydrorhamnose 3,5-epimerase
VQHLVQPEEGDAARDALPGGPHEEVKLVRCTRGAVYDVALDLLPGSPTYLGWAAAELSAANGRALHLPEWCAHGFLTLEDGADVFYQVSEFYHLEGAGGALG